MKNRKLYVVYRGARPQKYNEDISLFSNVSFIDDATGFVSEAEAREAINSVEPKRESDSVKAWRMFDERWLQWKNEFSILPVETHPAPTEAPQ